MDNLTPVKFLERGIYIRLETSNGMILGILQIINKQKDISDKRFIVGLFRAKMLGNGQTDRRDHQQYYLRRASQF
jgi:hypothetical protein